MRIVTINPPPRPNPPPTEDHKITQALALFTPWLIPAECEDHLALVEGTWIMTEHLLYKKLIDKRHRLPYCKEAANALESLAELLVQIRELCKECHANPSPESVRYVNATTWFVAVIQEIKSREFKKSLNPIPSLKNHKKDNLIGELRELIAALANNKNPYNQNTAPHSWTLTQACISLNTNHPNFQEKYWEPFLKTYRAWVKRLKSQDWKFLFYSETGRLMMTSGGRGRGQITLPQLRDFLEPLHGKSSSDYSPNPQF